MFQLRNSDVNELQQILRGSSPVVSAQNLPVGVTSDADTLSQVDGVPQLNNMLSGATAPIDLDSIMEERGAENESVSDYKHGVRAFIAYCRLVASWLHMSSGLVAA